MSEDQNDGRMTSSVANANRQDKPSNQAILDAARKSADAAPPLTEQQIHRLTNLFSQATTAR